MATGNKPTAAFVLVLIGGVFVLIGGLATIALGGFASALGSALHVGSGVGTGISVGGVLGVIAGIVMIISSILMNKTDVSKVKMWSIVAIVFTIISLGNFGGFVIGFILGLIGSILGLTYKG